MSETNTSNPDILPQNPPNTEQAIGELVLFSESSVLVGEQHPLYKDVQSAKAVVVPALQSLFPENPDKQQSIQERIDGVPFYVVEGEGVEPLLDRFAEALYDGQEVKLGKGRDAHILVHELVHAANYPCEWLIERSSWFKEAVTEEIAAEISGTTDPDELAYESERAVLHILLGGKNGGADLHTAARRAMLGDEKDAADFKSALDAAWGVKNALGNMNKLVRRATEAEGEKFTNRITGITTPWQTNRGKALEVLAEHYRISGSFMLAYDMENSSKLIQ